jgi:hypothetical protein
MNQKAKELNHGMKYRLLICKMFILVESVCANMILKLQRIGFTIGKSQHR